MKIFILDVSNKFIIRSCLEIVMIGRACYGFGRGHVFVVECFFFLTRHVDIFLCVRMLCPQACREDIFILFCNFIVRSCPCPAFKGPLQ